MPVLRPVSPECNDDGDVCAGDTDGIQFIQQCVKNDSFWRRAREVFDDDGNVIRWGKNRFKARGPYRILYRLACILPDIHILLRVMKAGERENLPVRRDFKLPFLMSIEYEGLFHV